VGGGDDDTAPCSVGWTAVVSDRSKNDVKPENKALGVVANFNKVVETDCSNSVGGAVWGLLSAAAVAAAAGGGTALNEACGDDLGLRFLAGLLVVVVLLYPSRGGGGGGTVAMAI